MSRFFQIAAMLTIILCTQYAAFADSSALALKEGRADDAIHLLRGQIATAPRDATARQLLRRAYYAEQAFSSAVHECEASVANALGESDNYLWLERNYGMKASQANPISAFSLAALALASNYGPAKRARLRTANWPDSQAAAPRTAGANALP